MMHLLDKNQFNERILLAILILTGALLRFWNLQDLPLMHDELSAFYRLQFDSFSELIEKGIKPDGHPAGIQVFLYYWTRLFGQADWVIKLPFLILGTGTIYLAYAVAKKWFGNTAGLFVAASVATLQFPILYSQIARPYSSGLFFSLLMVLYWTNFLFGNEEKRKANLAGFVIAAALCCYNHHFSLLFAAMVGFTGLFFLKKEQVKPYLLSGVLILILYLPHLPIFFAQLQIQGLAWLGKQGKSFFTEHVAFIFHHSPVVYSVMGGLFLLGVFLAKNEKRRVRKFQLISLTWFLLPIAVGFAYSQWMKPVLQHPVLIFSFPYLLFLVFSFYPTATVKLRTAFITALILVVNVTTLVWTREHHSVFCKQPFKTFSIHTQDFLKTHAASEVALVFNDNPKYLNHYFSARNPGIAYISLFNTGIGHARFRDTLATLNTDYLIAGDVPPDFLPIIKEFYPITRFRDFGFTYEFYVFSKNQSDKNEENQYFESQPVFSRATTPHWTYDTAFVKTAPDESVHYAMDATREWGPTFEVSLTTVTRSRHDFLDISLEMKGNCDPCGVLVCEFSKAGKIINWAGIVPKHQMAMSLPEPAWQKIYHTIRLTHLFKTRKAMEGVTLKVYYWNREKESVFIKNTSVRVREGNDRVYGLFESL
ncbi:MAG: glycosyltransferase family 39 protein [Saprospiraceae bacterium]|nr:glycosyltransferase family 39 protein [Saprospiraceae bacterium]